MGVPCASARVGAAGRQSLGEARGLLEQNGVASGEPLGGVVVAAAEHGGHRQAAGASPAEHQRVAGAQAGVSEGEPAEAVLAMRVDAGIVEDEVGAEARGGGQRVGEDLKVGAVGEAVGEREVEVRAGLAGRVVALGVEREGEDIRTRRCGRCRRPGGRRSRR